MTRHALLTGAVVAVAAQAGGTWTLDELAALDASKSYAELLEHAEDVPPKARTAEWKAMVGRAASSAVASTDDTPKDGFAGTNRGVALAKRFAFLSADAGFQGAVEASAVASMKKCAAGDDDCLALVTPALALFRSPALVELGKALRSGRRAVASLPLFARAIGATVDHPACREAVVLESTLAALELPPGEEWAKSARKVAFDACWKAMEKPLRDAMVHATDALRRNACAPMRAKKALTELQDDLCKELE